MNKITTQQQAILRLIQRSKPRTDGSYLVSKTLLPLVSGLPDELAATTQNDDGTGYLKLTDHGVNALAFMDALEVGK